MAGLALTAPVPPLALFDGQKWIAALGYGGRENVMAADIHGLSGDAAKFLVEALWVLPGKLLHAANAEKIKITQHGWPDRNQIL